jgi:hypothetical protein
MINIAMFENTNDIEHEKTQICYSNFIDNLKHKELFGENLDFSKFCNTETITKLNYHLINFDKCWKGQYVGQTYEVFQPILNCRKEFTSRMFYLIVKDLEDLFQDMTPTLVRDLI